MNNILEQLKWDNNVKNYCARNTRTAFGITNTLWDAYTRIKYIDSKTPEVWNVAVIDRWNWGWEELNTYWHVWVVTDIDIKNKKIRIYDWPNAYHFWTNMSLVKWYITPKKMIELWSKITLSTNNTNMWKYEEIFKKNYPNWSSIFKDLEWAKKEFWDVVFFLAIWLERVKK